MENLSISSHWKATWCERLLKSMYYVTLRHGSHHGGRRGWGGDEKATEGTPEDGM